MRERAVALVISKGGKVRCRNERNQGGKKIKGKVKQKAALKHKTLHGDLERKGDIGL